MKMVMIIIEDSQAKALKTMEIKGAVSRESLHESHQDVVNKFNP